MKYFVTLQGEEFEIELVPGPEGATVARLDGVSHQLDVRPIDGLARCAFALDGRVHDVQLEEDERGMQVTIDGRRHRVAIEDERERAAHLAAGSAPKGPVTVKSTMPGILRAVLVQPGQSVAAGQPLVILEAMKMENEIRAEHAGIVRAINVAAGTPVEGGADLLLLDPLPVAPEGPATSGG